jgi:hypothetical protein
MMQTSPLLFDDTWLQRASSVERANSWATDLFVPGTSEVTAPGIQYLDTIRWWIERFPMVTKKLLSDVQSFSTYDHLGAMNYLAFVRVQLNLDQIVL